MKNNYNKEIGAQMRKARQARKYSLVYVAEKMGMGKSTIAEYECGTVPITVVKLQEYCDVVGCDMYELLRKAESL